MTEDETIEIMSRGLSGVIHSGATMTMRELVKAVLAELLKSGLVVAPLEPTEAQYDAVSALDKPWRENNSFDVYRAMVAAACPGHAEP